MQLPASWANSSKDADSMSHCGAGLGYLGNGSCIQLPMLL